MITKKKPFLYYVIKNFIKNDFKNIIILTGYNKIKFIIIFSY